MFVLKEYKTVKTHNPSKLSQKEKEYHELSLMTCKEEPNHDVQRLSIMLSMIQCDPIRPADNIWLICEP